MATRKKVVAETARRSGARTGGETRGRIDTSRKERLHTLPDEYLHCRMNLHAMEPEGIYQWADDTGGTYEVLLNRCLRCGTIAEDFFYEGERAFPRSYTHPAGYLLQKSKVVEDPQLRKADYFSEYTKRNKKRYGNRDSLMRAKGITLNGEG